MSSRIYFDIGVLSSSATLTVTITVEYFAESGPSTKLKKKNVNELTDISSYPSKQNVSSPDRMSRMNPTVMFHSEKNE